MFPKPDPIKDALAHKRKFGVMPDEPVFPFERHCDGARPYESLDGCKARKQTDFNLRRGGAFAAQGAERD